MIKCSAAIKTRTLSVCVCVSSHTQMSRYSGMWLCEASKVKGRAAAAGNVITNQLSIFMLQRTLGVESVTVYLRETSQ